MTTIEHLKAKSAGRYDSTLKRLLLGENPFPVSIPYKRPHRGGDPAEILRVKHMLRSQSKETVGFGPTIQFDGHNTRRYGAGTLPGRITFETLQDLTRYIGKTAEAHRILEHARVITSAFPELRTWTAVRLSLLSQGDMATWAGIAKVVNYFLKFPKPWVYPREVSVGLHTKFVEGHYKAIIDILTHIAPTSLNESYTTWQDRLGLRSSSELIEGRFLDASLAPHLPRHMVAPVKEWNRCAFPAPAWVLITENRTTLLTLPPLPSCLALLGKGFAVSRLAGIEQIHEAAVYYWGDIDQHGFEILASLRNRLPKTSSCLMDEPTLLQCSTQIATENVEGTLSPKFVMENLTACENALWRKCADTHLRLEQEHIPHDVVVNALQGVAAEVAATTSAWVERSESSQASQ